VYPRWQVDSAVWWQWLFPIAALIVSGMLLAVRNRARGLLAAWLYFCGVLFPLLGFFDVNYFEFSFVSDHFLYLPSLGIITLFSAGIAVGLAQIPIHSRWVGYMACLILVGVLAALTMRQSRIYAAPIAFYRTTLERNPDSWMTHRNLGLELARAGRANDATDSFQSALALKPQFPLALNDLACSLALLDRFPEAVDYLRQALSLDPNLKGARQPRQLPHQCWSLARGGRRIKRRTNHEGR
jgi:tetratricopeptide (TPR) repeat protein